MSFFSTISYAVPSPSQCFKHWKNVSTSSSASGEVALEELTWRRKVTVARGEERWRLGQQNGEE